MIRSKKDQWPLLKKGIITDRAVYIRYEINFDILETKSNNTHHFNKSTLRRDEKIQYLQSWDKEFIYVFAYEFPVNADAKVPRLFL